MTQSGAYITSSFYRFSGWKDRWKAFQDMGARQLDAQGQPPLFSRHMGSGAGEGFSMMPDWSTYHYFAVWPDEATARAHLQGLHYVPSWSSNAKEAAHLLLHCIQSHGYWDQQQPFAAAEDRHPEAPLAVLTRASVRWNKLHRFWQYVPKSSRAIEQAEGVLFSKGVGEWPLIQQATISIWENEAKLKSFAYKDTIHKKIVALTRKENWYSEDLFARFRVIDTFGHYKGRPLSEKINPAQ